MKKKHLRGGVLTLLMATMIFAPMQVNAQEDESESLFDVGFDFVSSYIWRGTKFGTGPAIQPSISLSTGGFTVGGWGNYNFTSDEGAEADIYLSYDFNFGLFLKISNMTN